MDSQPSAAAFVAWIRSLHERTSYLHLSICACGQPSWQQPCPWCGFYPKGRDQPERERAAKQADAARAHFDALLGARGLFQAYCANWKRVVAYSRDATFAAWVDALPARWNPQYNVVTVADLRAFAALPVLGEAE